MERDVLHWRGARGVARLGCNMDRRILVDSDDVSFLLLSDMAEHRLADYVIPRGEHVSASGVRVAVGADSFVCIGKTLSKMELAKTT